MTPDAADVLAGVSGDHLWHDRKGGTCSCGWDYERGNGVPRLDQWLAHVAAAQVAALVEAGWRLIAPPVPLAVVDGHTDPCPAPGYKMHTAVGAGAISPPYRCHGCGAWFSLDEMAES